MITPAVSYREENNQVTTFVEDVPELTASADIVNGDSSGALKEALLKLKLATEQHYSGQEVDYRSMVSPI